MNMMASVYFDPEYAFTTRKQIDVAFEIIFEDLKNEKAF